MKHAWFDSIEVEFIPYEKQRYPTAGDWRIVNGMGKDRVLLISVAITGERRSEAAVAIHEIAEAVMCLANGVSQESVDEFDMAYEKNRQCGDEIEPGDHESAPYKVQHGLATAIERIVTTQTGLSWPDHEKNIEKLFEK